MNKQRLRDLLEKALQSGLKPVSPNHTLLSELSWFKAGPASIKHDLKDYIESEKELQVFDQEAMNFGDSMTLVTREDLLRWLLIRTAE
jgi:hypothetical protein